MRQKGFTLLEMLVALGIGSTSLLAGVALIFQVFYTTLDIRSNNIILTELDVSSIQIKKDLYMTHDTDLTNGVPQNSIYLEWTNYLSSDNSSIGQQYSSTYTINGTNLMRTYDNGENISVGIVGRNITNITFTTQDGKFIDVVITATSNDRRPISKSTEFSVYRRSEGIN